MRTNEEMRTNELLDCGPALVVVLALSSCACQHEDAGLRSYSVQFEAKADTGEALSGVRFFSSGRLLGESSSEGSLQVSVRGREGLELPLSVKCPKEFESPQSGRLRFTSTKKLGENEIAPLTYLGLCVRDQRDIAVVVQAVEAPGVPVVVDGETVSRTDELGNSHIALKRSRDVTSIALGLDTTENERLLPRNPRRVFELSQHDTVVVFQPALTVSAPKKKRAAPPPRHVPYRVR